MFPQQHRGIHGIYILIQTKLLLIKTPSEHIVWTVFFSQKKERPLNLSDCITMKLKIVRGALALLISCTAILGAADYCIDDSYSYRADSGVPANTLVRLESEQNFVAADTREDVSYCASLLGVLPIKHVSVQRFDDVHLCPGGMPFGAKMLTDGLIVVGFSDVDCTSGSPHPASDAGIQVKDIILKINGTPVGTSENMAKLVAASEGRPITITVRRNDAEFSVSVTPSLSNTDQVYKTGMWVRDNTAGIGTVTYVDPKSGAFAGLGHGICDSETGSLMPLSRGIVIDVTISGIQKGQSGVPGELKGHFSSGKIGTLLGNTHAGVYGVMTALPQSISDKTAIPIALKNEIHDGEATLLSTLDEGGICSYTVNIRKLKNSLDNKNMEITVTDPALIVKTGGIVQGMSGSPLIQEGKLIGAVTHVLINDPAKGYGIYIENMLTAAE